MGDQNTLLTTAEVRHLLRRAGLGPTPREVERLEGLTRGQAADQLLLLKPKAFRPGGRDFQKAHDKWLKFLVKGKRPVQCRLALFWHDHFAVNFSTVQDVTQMALYVRLLHVHALGNFKTFVKAVNKDPAMMVFLDTVKNRKAIPNENYARELLELFTLGVTDLLGAPNYTQDDIVQIARAFTGWRVNSSNVAELDASRHDFQSDFPERGPKVIFRTTGGFGPAGRDLTVNGEGEPEIDAVVDAIFDHTDSAGHNTVARRTTHRLLQFLCHDDPPLAVVDELIATASFATTWDLKALVRAILVHDIFYETAAPAPFGAATKKSVKWPVDFVVSTMRLLGLKVKGRPAWIPGGTYSSLRDHLENMGQVLMQPPSVFGWDWETAWLSSGTLLARYTFARDIAAMRWDNPTFRPDLLMDLTLTDPDDIVAAVLGVLAIDDQVDAADRRRLVDYLTDYGATTSLDLGDWTVRNVKLHGLFALAMQLPAYQLH
ncbi:MAG TPA: DUF1800 domain-containing protein [Candidatus Limnocylindria bacterium]|nr:DUF1800 domain-containing protein [Candidatus Limnocylindria bacterium]